MDLEIIILSEVSQPEKDKYMILLILWNLFLKWYKGTYLQSRIRLKQGIENKLMAAKGKRGDKLGAWN